MRITKISAQKELIEKMQKGELTLLRSFRMPERNLSWLDNEYMFVFSQKGYKSVVIQNRNLIPELVYEAYRQITKRNISDKEIQSEIENTGKAELDFYEGIFDYETGNIAFSLPNPAWL